MPDRYPELPLTNAPMEGLEDRADGKSLVTDLNMILERLPGDLDELSCARRITGVLRDLKVEVVLLKADLGKDQAKTDSTSGVKRAILPFDQPESAGKKLTAGTLPFVGYETLWLDLSTLAALEFLVDHHLDQPSEDLIAAVRDYLFVPGALVKLHQHPNESASEARYRLWAFHNLPMIMYSAHKRPGRKSVKARHRVDIPYRNKSVSSEVA